jgi:hypothetical protein
MKAITIFAALLLCLLAGCRTPSPPESSKPAAAFEAGDDFKIETAVYGFLLEKHPWDGGAYSAIYIDAGDDRAMALIRKIPKPSLPLQPVSRAKREPNQPPVDVDTGKPGVILNAKAVDPTNGVSEAIGTWYAGEGQTGLYAFVLVQMDGQWTIQSAK